jgi:hypothetical protein
MGGNGRRGRVLVTSLAAVGLSAPILVLASGISTQAATVPVAIGSVSTLPATIDPTASPTIDPTASPTIDPTASPTSTADEDLTPAQLDEATGGDDYTMTLAARWCQDYSDVFANRSRNNIMESLQNLGPNTNYAGGEAVNPAKEDQPPQSNCVPLVDWRFQLGSGHTGKTPATDNLSTITGAGRIVETTPSVPEINATGNTTGHQIAGAVTITLSKDELALAKSGSLWVQGGTKSHPLGQAPDFGPTAYGFAALRCANDNVNGDNVEYISLKSGQRHVFCYYYAVKPPPRSGTIIIRKVVNGENPGNITFDFAGNISYNPGGAFSLKDGQSIEFIRGASDDTGFLWKTHETVPANWKVSVACRSAGSSTTEGDGANGVAIHLAARDTVTCTFTNTPNPPTGRLDVQKSAVGADGTFPYTVTGPSGSSLGSGSVTVADGDVGSMGTYTMTETGNYTVTETLPVDGKGEWALTGVACTNATGSVTDASTATITVPTLDTTKGVLCVLTNTFSPNAASLTVRSKTAGAPGGMSSYEIVPTTPSAGSLPEPRLQVADNVVADTLVTAQPKTPADDTRALDPEQYRISGFGPVATPAGSWRITDISCLGGADVTRNLATSVVTLTLPPRGSVTCDFVWTLEPPSTLAVTKAEVISGGARTSDVVIAATCADEAHGQLTVTPDQSLPASIDPTLRFVAPTRCVITETERGGNPVDTTWSLTGPTGTRTGIGTSVNVAIDHAGHPAGAYVVTFTNTYRAGKPTPTPTPSDSSSTGGSSTEPQVPIVPPDLPETIDPELPNVVLPGEVPGSGGRKIRAQIFCTPLNRAGDAAKSLPFGDAKVCRVERSTTGKVTVTITYPPPVKVTLVLSAPATADHKAFYFTKSWIARA